jgi:predicted Zn-dependent protease
LPIILAILIILLLFGGKLLPGLGHWLGDRSRKPFQQAKWMWAWLAGTEDESLEAERDYGRECAREFSRQFSGTASPKDQELVNAVGAKLSDAINDPRREFRFTVVQTAAANAYALPGGFVFITEPLLALCDRNRDEIAFFLGHEIGHILCGHARDKLTASTIFNAVMARLSGIGEMLRQALVKGYSRDLELEADREAVRLTAAAGLDSSASLRALKRLAQISPDRAGLAEYFSSHPSLSERIQQLEQRRDG